MSQKPSSKLIAKALPKGDRFTGQFSLPGLIPDLVRGRDGNIQFFDTEQQAYVAAMEAVIRLYDSRTIDTRKAGGYRRLTGAELAVLLDEVDITPTYFAEIVGVPQHRVMKWLDGEQDIPHSAHVLVKLMKLNDDNFRVAEEITEEYRESS
ncbi:MULTISPECIES: hypothetical protein [Brucella/Ochrobactrum group]|uniref:DNA-binding transcriptional regulator YiaG n=2 Tax=Brucella/Ochrobactrum group TaxID=2826938 RepID=A0A5C5CT02_9HYPH|nr:MULTISPECIES: hypothetical protein [Brucella]KAB2699372.1 hypothetical protein F9K79_09770 [Ochrobactrum sp. Kaboul]MBB4092416.1 DNA-binding transcriptional regulator YiaG [Brucella pecoris]NKW80329.1 hypothetical protein [Brucella pecoris]TNV14264.1 hypothetical protein FIB18_03220 [Brucella pecoris]SPL65392.1 hypothetical protein OHAE_1259 [[Ochrobactrum] soli]